MPLSMEKQVAIMYSLVNGLLDDVEIARVIPFENAFHSYMDANHPSLLATIRKREIISDESGEALSAAIQDFKNSVPY